jgi:hypothetical protein
MHDHGPLLQNRDRVGLLDSGQMATSLFSTDIALILFLIDRFLALFRSHRLELAIQKFRTFPRLVRPMTSYSVPRGQLLSCFGLAFIPS